MKKHIFHLWGVGLFSLSWSLMISQSFSFILNMLVYTSVILRVSRGVFFRAWIKAGRKKWFGFDGRMCASLSVEWFVANDFKKVNLALLGKWQLRILEEFIAFKKYIFFARYGCLVV